MCRQWRGKVSQLVLVLVVLVLVLCGFGAVRCELPPWRPELSGSHREARHRPLPPPPPRHHKLPPYHPGHRGLQPTPDDILALHPSHPLSFYSQRDGHPHGPHRRPPPHPAPRPPPHPAPSQHQPEFGPAPPHQPEFGPAPPHQSEFGPPHHTTSFAQAPLHHPEHQSEHQPEHQPGHEPDHEPEIQHGDHFHFRDFTLLHRQRHHETHQQDVHFEPESGCRINGKMYAPGQSWHLANCRRGTCVKFGHNYYVSEDGCSVKYNNANYACVIYQEKDRPYPDCCPYYRCNPEN